MTSIQTDLTVVLCTFNGSRHIVQQLQSIVAQTVRPGRLLVMDDSSTDDTTRLVESFIGTAAFRATGIQAQLFVASRQQGFVQNFARGMAQVDTPLLALADQDDRWEATKLERQLRLINADVSALLIASDALLSDDQLLPLGGTLRESLKLKAWEEEALRSARPERILIRRNIAPGMTMLARTWFIRTLHPFPEGVPHDQWMSACAAALGGYRYLDECLVAYRIHSANQIGVPGRSVRSRVVRRWSYLTGSATSDGVRVEHFVRAFAQYVAARTDATDVARDLASQAARFQSSRSAMQGRRRLARLPTVARSLLRGDYARLATASTADALADLLRASPSDVIRKAMRRQ